MTVQATQDSKVEETMSVHLLSTSFGNITQGIAIIVNDDAAVVAPNISIGMPITEIGVDYGMAMAAGATGMPRLRFCNPLAQFRADGAMIWRSNVLHSTLSEADKCWSFEVV